MPEAVTTISVTELREIFDLLVTQVAGNSGSVVGISQDYFWSIHAPEKYDVENWPLDLTIGQISESWNNLQLMREGKSDLIGYGLVWLAQVIRAIGDETIG